MNSTDFSSKQKCLLRKQFFFSFSLINDISIFYFNIHPLLCRRVHQSLIFLFFESPIWQHEKGRSSSKWLLKFLLFFVGTKRKYVSIHQKFSNPTQKIFFVYNILFISLRNHPIWRIKYFFLINMAIFFLNYHYNNIDSSSQLPIRIHPSFEGKPSDKSFHTLLPN